MQILRATKKVAGGPLQLCERVKLLYYVVRIAEGLHQLVLEAWESMASHTSPW